MKFDVKVLRIDEFVDEVQVWVTDVDGKRTLYAAGAWTKPYDLEEARKRCMENPL